MASATEEKMGELFEKYQKSASVWTALSEMGHQQLSASVASNNTAGNYNREWNYKRKKIQSNRYENILGMQHNTKNNLHIFWEEGKKNLADYVTKHHPI